MTAEIKSSDWSYSVELSRALARHGVRVSLSTSGGFLSKEQRREAARVPGLAIYDGGFDVQMLGSRSEETAKASKWLQTLEERLKPDIVHLNGCKFGAIPLKSPVLISAHSSSPSSEILGKSTDWTKFRMNMVTALNRANLVIFPTTVQLESFKDLYRFNSQARVIPHFRRLTDYRVSAKQKYVYSAGASSRWPVLSSAIQSTANGLNWPVVVESDGTVESIIGDSSINTRLTSRVQSAKTADQLSKASIYCMPVHSGHSDVPVLEGALSKCALIISDQPNLRENWNNCALFVPQDDTELLIKNLELLIVNQELRDDLALRAYERAKEFSPERCIDDYLDAYNAAYTNKFQPLRKR